MIAVGPTRSNDTVCHGERIPSIPPLELLAAGGTEHEDNFAYHFRTTYDKIILLSEEELSLTEELQVHPSTLNTPFQPGDRLWQCTFNETSIEGYIYPTKAKVATTTGTASGTVDADKPTTLPDLPYAVRLSEEWMPNGKPPYSVVGRKQETRVRVKVEPESPDNTVYPTSPASRHRDYRKEAKVVKTERSSARHHTVRVKVEDKSAPDTPPSYPSFTTVWSKSPLRVPTTIADQFYRSTIVKKESEDILLHRDVLSLRSQTSGPSISSSYRRSPVEAFRDFDASHPASKLKIEEEPEKGYYIPTGASKKSYRLHDNNTFVEGKKEPRGEFTGQWDVDLLNWARNIGAVIETAYQSLPPQTGSDDEPPCGWLNEAEEPSTSYCYHNLQEDPSKPYPGIEHKRTFEVLLWQTLSASSGSQNSTIVRTIESLTSEYIDGEEKLRAVGASCTSSSSVGSANIDGVRSTYSNFQRNDTPVPTRKDDCAKRFGAETLACTLNINDDSWLKWLFDSTGLPSPLDTATESVGGVIGNIRFNAQLEYLQADQLRQVLLQAYSTYAIKLMYNDGRDFIGVNKTRLKSHVPDLTAFVAGAVIEPGVMPAAVPVALFGLWALISSGLCLVYGFRRRWSAILDGHTVFRLGAELQQTDRVRLQRYSTIAEIEECEALHEIPGFVSDMEPKDDVGRIGLMDGKPARKDKLYQ
ncbi:hypothetical protein J4E91_005028 [Alternaria rosae]|nr:hypothetical protein J4E91_005028 [Alternaria rosae]